jgi:hypothetical protein
VSDTLAAALSAYADYLRFSVEHPELGSRSMASGRLNLPPAGEVWDAETTDSERYLWHVAYTLHVLDRVKSLASDYDVSIEKHLKYHAAILRECWDSHWAKECSNGIGTIVKKVIKEDA